MTFALRPYQERGLAEIREAFRTNQRVLYQGATGSGKGTMLAYMARHAAEKGRRVCAMVHRNELVLDLSGRLEAFGVPHALVTAGARPTRTQVVVASVPTLARRLDHYRDSFDFIIVDECHHCLPENTWGKCIEAFPSARLVGYSATPERADGRGLGDVFQSMVLGPPTRELIEQGFLADYRAFTAEHQPDLSKVRSRMGDFDQRDLANAMSENALVGDAVEHYREHAGGKPAVAFCVTIAHAEAVAEQFKAAGYRSVSVDGSLDDEERRRRIYGLEDGSVQVLTSCQLLGEGVDIPAISAAILLRPTKSLALCLQQVGRALRPKSDGSHAIILDHAGNLGRHGLPCAERAWSLDAKKRKAKDGASPIRTCMACYAVLSAGTAKCPNCGNTFEVAPRELPQTAAGQLVEVSRQFWDSDGRPVIQRTKGDIDAAARKCRTLEDFQALARSLGFKPGWAFYQFKMRSQRRHAA